MISLNQVINYQLCIGCGICELIGKSANAKMLMGDTGFYKPNFSGSLNPLEENIIQNTCPSVNIIGDSKSNNSIWGNYYKIVEGWSTDELIRHKAASGGVITSMSIYLLENKLVDGIMHVGTLDESPNINELQLSLSSNEVISKAASRYAPSLIFNKFTKYFNSDNSYAFIGKPCDVAALKRLLNFTPSNKVNIKYYLSFFCAGVPSYNATRSLSREIENNDTPYKIKYRGDGWPGNFIAHYRSGKIITHTYNDSWGKVFGKNLGLRCKLCPDGIGLSADITVGDSWDSLDGYPLFHETKGRSFIFVRTSDGLKLFNGAIEQKYISVRKFNITKLGYIQKSQYYRRLYSGYRILGANLFFHSFFRFKKLGIIYLMTNANIYKGIRNTLGTLKRIILKR